MRRVITVGTFDGVHRGHREVIATLIREAAAKGAVPTVVTFDRHPLATVNPAKCPPLIESLQMRDEMLRRAGVDVIVIPFTEEIRRKTAREWMLRLREDYDAAGIVIGYDNRFGSDGSRLDTRDFIRAGKECGIDVTEATEIEGCSSSAIRSAVAEGDLDKATRLLGRPFSISGRVTKGKQLGRTIGFPTANLSVDPRQLLPPKGVYAGTAVIDGTRHPAIINIGTNPTVSDSDSIKIEAHIKDFEGELYGRPLTLELSRKIRDEKKFASLDDLKRQIKEDIVSAGLAD